MTYPKGGQAARALAEGLAKVEAGRPHREQEKPLKAAAWLRIRRPRAPEIKEEG
ncbi:hypothetical protein [Amycolatopsis azurea]|uniref:hypothetical protein n=1 Tax=Amycolatopsis azurea TaxID=36819 RepID=UPI0012F91C5A|nr:hypothetical protein [Amycolatopsis azurea]